MTVEIKEDRVFLKAAQLMNIMANAHLDAIRERQNVNNNVAILFGTFD